MTKTKVAIIGGGGYTGKELLKILKIHPYFEIAALTSDKHAGTALSDVFPDLGIQSDLKFTTHDTPQEKGAVVFLATPNDTSARLLPQFAQEGRKVVDLSGAFRLSNPEIFQKVYGFEHPTFDWKSKTIYGIPELFRDSIKEHSLIANPGCYPTGAIIPLHLVKDYSSEIHQVVVNAASGVSGAGGRVEDAGFNFASVYENFRAYKILKHQHEPEIQEYTQLPLIFTPHLLPAYRGILTTSTIVWKNKAPTGLEGSVEAKALNEPFLRYRKTPEEIDILKVANTNFVDISLRSRDNITVLISAIDNLGKGAAGQAIQNMNLICGFPETSGLL